MEHICTDLLEIHYREVGSRDGIPVILLVTCGVAYNIQNPLAFREPSAPDREARAWYVYYFHTARGRQALSGGAKDLCRYLWKTWSPDWRFSEETFLCSAEAFENPDFALVVEHSYCHRTGCGHGDGSFESGRVDTGLSQEARGGTGTVLLNLRGWTRGCRNKRKVVPLT